MTTLRRLSIHCAARTPAFFAALALAGVLLAPADAFAQQKGKKGKEEDVPTKGYTIQYFLTGMAVLLIAAPLCWPAMRRWDLPFHEEE